MSDSLWHLLIGGHSVGPLTADEVRTSLASGSADRATLAHGPGLADWTPLGASPSSPDRRLRPRRRSLRPLRDGLTRSTSRSTAPRCSSSRGRSTRARPSSPRRA
ncbi:MAG: DUF4339 domain-containing protein [Holophagales bacterium]|nr:DUF4339 domain-containing protein [Holophagales bacterium]